MILVGWPKKTPTVDRFFVGSRFQSFQQCVHSSVPKSIGADIEIKKIRFVRCVAHIHRDTQNVQLYRCSNVQNCIPPKLVAE